MIMSSFCISRYLTFQVEQFVITDPEKSWEEFDRMIANAEKFHQLLKLPYRVVNIVAGKTALCRLSLITKSCVMMLRENGPSNHSFYNINLNGICLMLSTVTPFQLIYLELDHSFIQ